MVGLLEKACDRGLEVRVWYVGLSSPRLHIARVQARVARGGHPISDELVYRRYERGRENLIRLLPALTELRIFDNSVEADPAAGEPPSPALVIHVTQGKTINVGDLARTPEWAKPIVAAALILRESM